MDDLTPERIAELRELPVYAGGGPYPSHVEVPSQEFCALLDQLDRADKAYGDRTNLLINTQQKALKALDSLWYANEEVKRLRSILALPLAEEMCLQRTKDLEEEVKRLQSAPLAVCQCSTGSATCRICKWRGMPKYG